MQMESNDSSGQACLEAVLARLGGQSLRVFPRGSQVLHPDPQVANLYLQVDSPARASELKQALLVCYEPSQEITVIRGAATSQEQLVTSKLQDLDRAIEFDRSTMVLAPALPKQEQVGDLFTRLVKIVSRLRGDEGCPWDREQTHETMKPCLLEECYEVLEAIDQPDADLLRQELGDLLLQVLFHAQLAQEQGNFEIADVLTSLQEKLITRHAHVFGGKPVANGESALRSWERIKRGEAGDSDLSVFAGSPQALPALMQAQALQKQAARVGFDWESIEGPWAKLQEELHELTTAVAGEQQGHARIEHELGDLLFAMVNVARALNIDAEQALRAAGKRFVARFRYIEEKAAASGKELETMTLEEMDALWEEAKGKLTDRDQ